MAQILEPYVHLDGPKKGQTEDGYYVDQKTGIIYFWKRMGDKRVKFSCKAKQLRAAKIFANKKLETLFEPEIKKSKLILEDHINSYYKYKERLFESGQDKANTWKNVRNAIKDFRPFWDGLTPQDITRDKWGEFCEWWPENKKKTNGEIKQMENAVKYFRAFMQYLAEEIDPVSNNPVIPTVIKIWDPYRRQTSAARKQKKARTITEREFRKILEAIPKVYPDPQDQADLKLQILLMYTMAFRLEEAAGLKFDQLDLYYSTPYYRFSEGNNKANLDGRCPVHSAVLEELRRREETYRSEFVFPQKTNPDKPQWGKKWKWEALRDAANLGWHWSAHTLRHTCLTELFNNPDVPDSLVIKCYRISWVEALNTYIHVTDDALKQVQDAKRVRI